MLNAPQFIKRPFFQILVIFIITRILIFIIGSLSYSIFPERGLNYQKKTINETLNLENVWDKFDSGWYKKLASQGYPQKPFTEISEETWGFMPLYSILINLISTLTGFSIFISGVILSNLCALLAMYFFYKLAEEKYNRGVEVVGLIMISAGSFYLSIVYDSGLYILITSLVFYLTHKKYFGWAFFIAGLASITRIQGFLLFVIPAIEILQNHRSYIFRYVPAFLLALLPIVILMVYLEITCGEPLAFIKIQHAWGSSSLFPLQGFIGLIKGLRPGGSLTNAVFWVLIIGFTLKSQSKLPISYLIFIVLYFLLSTSNAELFGTTRYMLGLLPLYIAVSLSSGYLKYLFVLINILFLSLTISAFVTNSMVFI